MMSLPTYSFDVGHFHCTVICDQDRDVPLEDAKRMFPNVPGDELEREMGGAGKGVPFSINILLIETPEQRILVDTSVGGDGSQLLENLRQDGIEPESIDRVILTHGHGDHIGGIVKPNGDLAFPNARYSIWKSEWEFLLGEAANSDDPTHPVHNLTRIQDHVDLLERETEIAPGVCVLPAPGHTVGHLALLLESEGERLLHIVDAAHHPAQLTHSHWSPAFDKQPDAAAATRRALAERAARDKVVVLAYHFAFPGLGSVRDDDGVLRWEALRR